MKRELIISVCCLVAGGVLAEAPSTNRPASWAQPITLAGVPNLHQVSTNLYRSAQPTAEGMSNLKRKGIETIVNLRSFHSDRDEIGSTGLAYEHIYMKAWHPERKEVVRFLQVATNPNRTPVLVHCLHGADRTGTMCALYRIAVQGWSKEDAIREMTSGGFGFHKIFDGLPKWIQELDVESLRKDAGIKTGTEQPDGAVTQESARSAAPSGPLLLDPQYQSAIGNLVTSHTDPSGHTTTKEQIVERRAIRGDLKRLSDRNPSRMLQQLVLYAEYHQQDRKIAKMVGEMIPWFGFSVDEVRTAVQPFLNSERDFLPKASQELLADAESGKMQKQHEYIVEILNQD